MEKARECQEGLDGTETPSHVLMMERDLAVEKGKVKEKIGNER